MPAQANDLPPINPRPKKTAKHSSLAVKLLQEKIEMQDKLTQQMEALKNSERALKNSERELKNSERELKNAERTIKIKDEAITDMQVINSMTMESHLRQFKKNLHYENLGDFDEMEDMTSHFHNHIGEDTNFTELMYAGDVVPEACEPPNKINLSTTSPTVLFKRALTPKNFQYFVVIGILITNVLSDKEKPQVVNVLKKQLPYLEKDVSGTWCSRGKKDCLNGCNCNGGSKVRYSDLYRTLSVSFGCFASGGAWKCRLFRSEKSPFEVREGGNSQELEALVDKMADVAAKYVKAVRRKTYEKMTLSREYTHCRRGIVSRIFSGVTISADYAVHPHVDSQDAADGVTAIISFQKPGPKPCMHWLPNYFLPGQTQPGIGFSLGDNTVYLSCARYEKHASTRVSR